jgi:arylsulfatase A-like enzyme
MSRAPLRAVAPWLAASLGVSALGVVLALGTARLPPSFPALDPVRSFSVDWPLLLPLAWLAALALIPWALAEPPRRAGRGLLLLALVPVFWLHLHPEPFEEQRLVRVDHGVATVMVVEGGALVQRQWLRSVETRVPLLQLPQMLRSERALAGVAHALHHQADARRAATGDLSEGELAGRQRLRAWLWALQRGITSAWILLRFLTLPAALWLAVGVLRPALLGRWGARLCHLALLLPLALPPVANLLLLAGLELGGLPDTGSLAGGFAINQIGWLVAVALALGGARLGRVALGPVAAALILAGCGGADAPSAQATGPTPSSTEAAAEAPDLVLVLAAGARADLGGAGATGPLIRQTLDARGVSMFAAAYAQSPSPFVSLGSVLTGRYPTAVPMCGLPDRDAKPEDRPWCATLPAERHTLPEVLALYGYRTALLYANLPAADVYEGRFQHAVDLTVTLEDTRTDWERLHREAAEFWQQPGDQPRLLVVVVADMQVYERPDLAAMTGWSGQVSKLMEPMLAHSPELAQRVTGPADPRQLYLAYEQAAQGLAAGIRGLLTTLGNTSSRPRWVVVAGSTGINLGEAGGNAAEHPTWGANQLLLQRTVHVPLLIIPPNPEAQPRDIKQPVELVDLFPTLANLVGATPPAGLPGQDLLVDPFPEDVMAWSYAAHGDMLALRQGSLLYSVRGMFHNGTALDPEVTDFLVKAPDVGAFRQLHDVMSDPLQEHNLASDHPLELEDMHRLLVEIRTGLAAAPEDALTVERLWELRMTRSEGYW